MVFGPFTIKVIKGGSWMGVRGVIFWGWVGLQVIYLTLYGFFLTPYIMASRGLGTSLTDSHLKSGNLPFIKDQLDVYWD